MKNKLIGVLLLALFVAGGAKAGVVRLSAKAVKFTAKTATQPVRHPVKDAKHAAHAVKVILW